MRVSADLWPTVLRGLPKESRRHLRELARSLYLHIDPQNSHTRYSPICEHRRRGYLSNLIITFLVNIRIRTQDAF